MTGARMTTSGEIYHVPVLRDEVVELLVTDRGGVYVDGTLGGGGHFFEIAKMLDGGAVIIGIDRDSDALDNVKRKGYNDDHDNNVGDNAVRAKMIFEKSRFSLFDEILRIYNIEGATGILVDLGVSSHQIDVSARGFMYMQDAPLDMRMDQSSGVTAAQILSDSDVYELAEIFDKYGEIKNPHRVAETIKNYMKRNVIATSGDLKKCIEEEYGKNVDIKIFAKLFQSLRIVVNNELDELETFLAKLESNLTKGGRVGIISYHSLEDRMVKEFFRNAESKCICPLEQKICMCNKSQTLRRVTKKVISASENEIKKNPRSRSARLRVAEKI